MKKIFKISIAATVSFLLTVVNSHAASPAFTFSGFSLTAATSVDLLSKFSTDSDAPSSAYIFTLDGNSASLSGTTLLGISEGTVTVTGYVSSTLGFDEGSVSAIISVLNQTPTVSFSAFDLTVGGGNIDLNQYFNSNSTGAKSFFINGKSASLDGTTLAGINAGTVTVYGFVDTTVGFNSASATTTISVYNQIPTITFNGFNIALGTVSTPGVNLASLILSNSPGAKSFTIVGDTNVARLTGNVLSATGLGTVTITGKIAKAQGYNAVSQTIFVNIIKNATPQFVVPGTVTGLFGLVRRYAAKQTITISGTNLPSNITITSPVNLKISSALVSVPGARVVQPISSGQANFELQIELANTSTATTVSGVITITSGSLRQTILVFGEVVSSTITGTTGVSDNESPQLSVYPNPVSSGNEIHFNLPVSGVLLNLEGKVVSEVVKQNEISTIGLVPGIYLFKSVAGNQLKISIE